jgi:hypothetical protein
LEHSAENPSLACLVIRKEELQREEVIDTRFYVGDKLLTDIRRRPGAMLFIRESNLTRALDRTTNRLSEFIEAHKGWMSIPARTETSKRVYDQELFTRREFLADRELQRVLRPCVRGEDTQHYFFVGDSDANAQMYVNSSGMDEETRSWQLRSKVICQRITGQNTRRFIAACDVSGEYVAHPSTNLLFLKGTGSVIGLLRLTALLNAECTNEYYKTLFGEANTNITADVLEYLPVPNDFFEGKSGAHDELDRLIAEVRSRASHGMSASEVLLLPAAVRVSALIGDMFGLPVRAVKK